MYRDRALRTLIPDVFNPKASFIEVISKQTGGMLQLQAACAGECRALRSLATNHHGDIIDWGSPEPALKKQPQVMSVGDMDGR